MTTRMIAATFSVRREADRARRVLVERLGVGREDVSAADLAQYPDEDGQMPLWQQAIVATQVDEEDAARVREALVREGGSILVDATISDQARIRRPVTPSGSRPPSA